MKVFPALIAGLLITMALFASCAIMPSGELIEKAYVVDAFTSVSVDSAIICKITKGTSHSVVGSFDRNVEDFVQVSVSGSTLILSLKPAFSYLMEVKIDVTTPTLGSLTVNGASRCTISGFTAALHSLSIDIDGAGSLNWTGGDLTECTIEADGASTVAFSGFSADTMTVDINGASRIEGVKGTANVGALSLKANGASAFIFDVTNTASGTIDGASRFMYGLNPNLTGITVLGASTLAHRE